MRQQQEQKGRVFNSKQINLRAFTAKALVLCLTAGITIFVDQLMPSGSRSSVNKPMLPKTEAIKFTSPLVIKSIPGISFPASLNGLDNVDFWIIASADLDSEGVVRNISVNFMNAITFREQSFRDNVLLRVDEKQSRLIMRELTEMLVGQISQVQFEPAVTGGVTRSSHVVVSTHFDSYKNGAGKGWEIETQIDAQDGRFVSGHRIDRAFMDY